jgi:hypothetical protein
MLIRVPGWKRGTLVAFHPLAIGYLRLRQQVSREDLASKLRKKLIRLPLATARQAASLEDVERSFALPV